MSSTPLPTCEPSCSDSPLSVTSNIIGILTFAYTSLLATFVFAISWNGSSAEIKRFGKTVAFLKPRIEQLQSKFGSDSSATNQAAKTLSATLPMPSPTLNDRVKTLYEDFTPLLKHAQYLWSVGSAELGSGVPAFNVNYWRRVRWIWNQANLKAQLSEVEARFAALLFYAEKYHGYDEDLKIAIAVTI
ncbi:hypothetical protein F4803DRAFT_101460 [Xylaria telfairii]|nr:hypothetical protein F4803DRAFT_101460 [Xylaria telfairii]